MFNKYNIKIHFARRTFQWNSEARGKAAVHVVIIGFGGFDVEEKYLFEYKNIRESAHKLKVKNINPYLIEGGDIVINPRNKPISNAPKIVFGSMPNDSGNFILTEEERKK